MNNFMYEVIKENIAYYDVGECPDIEVIDRFDCPAQALRLKDQLEVNSKYGENFYVQVLWGSVDNV